ncbi:hypothetical protein C2142_25280 [Streptomyces sp. CB01881]|nr:hypothetical protein C2142_25280 [Streptomyces sp. CB01881]
MRGPQSLGQTGPDQCGRGSLALSTPCVPGLGSLAPCAPCAPCISRVAAPRARNRAVTGTAGHPGIRRPRDRAEPGGRGGRTGGGPVAGGNPVHGKAGGGQAG